MKRRILVVDDAIDQIQVLGKALSAEHDILAATSGADALSVAEEQLPDLMLLDMSMPGMSGVQVMAHLRQNPRLQRMPVIFVTADDSAEAESSALAAGGNDFVTKPVNMDVLRARIRLQLTLIDREHALEKLNSTLEDKVAARTRDLEAARIAAEAASVAKTQFMGRVSHELLTPIHQLFGALRLMERKPDSPKLADWVRVGMENTQRLTSMIDNLLFLTRIEDGRPQTSTVTVNAAALLDQLHTRHASAANARQIQIHVEAAELPGPLLGDEKLISAALDAYVDNAIKFAGRGRIDVTVRAERQDDTHVWLRFDVSDEGPGIADEAQSRLFKIFEQGDNSFTRAHGGAGLGLVRVAETARLLDGSAGFEHVEPHGSRFWFTARCTRATR